MNMYTRLSVAAIWMLMVFVMVACRHNESGLDLYRMTHPQTVPSPDGNLYVEGEEFVPGGSWEALPWGTNYYAATFANTFMSRQAYLGAPPQCERSVSERRIRVDAAGEYLVLVRYEAPHRFQTQFRVQLEQDGEVVFDRLYGALDNVRIWAFGEGLQEQVAWGWGAVENMVWEGHDAVATLAPGEAMLRLIVDRQPEPAARRNVDLVLLTQDEAEVQRRIEKERYLPLDGMLTQQGDLFMRLQVAAGSAPLKLRYGPGQEHSPYWVHLRDWPRRNETPVVMPGQTSDWIEVGQVLDSLNHGQWRLEAVTDEKDASLDYRVDFAGPTADGTMQPIASFSQTDPALELAYFGDTRYRRTILHRNTIIQNLVKQLEAQTVAGPMPDRFPIYGYTFDPPDGKTFLGQEEAAEREAAIARFLDLFHLRLSQSRDSATSTYHDIRHVKTEDLADHLKALGTTRLANLRVVSQGDEISLPKPAKDNHASFRAWLQEQGMAPAELLGREGSLDEMAYLADWSQATAEPRRWYWSRRYDTQHGIAAVKTRTEIVRSLAPKAHVGANFSPHHGGGPHAYIGPVYKWVKLFREGGMTMPWSEDYVWQLPVGSQQVNTISLDLFRAGIRHRPHDPIHFYVMPHWPGNTPNMWRRHFYSALAHGMKMVNLFEFRPVHDAYTENYVDATETYLAVHKAFAELAVVEDHLVDGAVQPSKVGLWFSETADIWRDNAAPFGAAKRALYLAIRHQAGPLDMIIEADALDGTLPAYDVLYLADRHVSRAASQAIAEWVRAGGTLVATAGAGAYDEYNQPNPILQNLLGVQYGELAVSAGDPLQYLKQDLPFAEPMAHVRWGDHVLPVYGATVPMNPAGGATKGTFSAGSPAIVAHESGDGRTMALGFLPGLTYLAPALPKRPVDRGSTDDAYTHFLPVNMHPGAATLIREPAAGVADLISSDPLVTYHRIDSSHGTAIPIASWRTNEPTPVTLTWRDAPTFTKARLASGAPIQVTRTGNDLQLTFVLDIGDVVVLE